MAMLNTWGALALFRQAHHILGPNGHLAENQLPADVDSRILGFSSIAAFG